MVKWSMSMDLMVMMSGSVLDVEPFLISRNTLGNGKTTNQNLKDKSQMVVAESGGVALGNAEVEVMVVDYTRCQS